jgi:hypothetical protein
MQAWRWAISRARGPPQRLNDEATKRNEPSPMAQRVVVIQTGLRWRCRNAFMLIIYWNKRRELVAFDGAARRLVNIAVRVGSTSRASWMSAFFELIYREDVNRSVRGLVGLESPLFFGSFDLTQVVDAGGTR